MPKIHQEERQFGIILVDKTLFGLNFALLGRYNNLTYRVLLFFYLRSGIFHLKALKSDYYPNLTFPQWVEEAMLLKSFNITNSTLRLLRVPCLLVVASTK